MYIYIYIRIEICKMHITMETELLLETLLLAIKMYTGFTTDVIWVNTRVCSVTYR